MEVELTLISCSSATQIICSLSCRTFLATEIDQKSTQAARRNVGRNNVGPPTLATRVFMHHPLYARLLAAHAHCEHNMQWHARIEVRKVPRHQFLAGDVAADNARCVLSSRLMLHTQVCCREMTETLTFACATLRFSHPWPRWVKTVLSPPSVLKKHDPPYCTTPRVR